jgi:peptide-methionine (S)-S-oxide reductase
MTKERAVLAGGCFWGMEDLIRKLPGVIDTTVGYTGGSVPDPTNEIVKSKTSGHAEAIEIIFDNEQLPYRALLEFFFQIHDPSTKDRQGNDAGSSYRSAIFFVDDAQKQTAETLIATMNASKKWPDEIVTEITPASKFYPAEGYHQDYLQRTPNGYTCHYIRPTWKLVE